MISANNIAAKLNFWAEQSPEKLAVIDGEKRITYAQLNDTVYALSAAMADLGIRKGDLALMLLPNHAEMLAIFFALNRIGAVCIPCTAGYKEAEVAERARKTPPRIAFCYSQEQVDTVHREAPAGWSSAWRSCGDCPPRECARKTCRPV